jgi:hypothetical protein
LDAKIQNIKNDTGKVIAIIQEYDEHKKFLQGIFKTEDPKWYE